MERVSWAYFEILFSDAPDCNHKNDGTKLLEIVSFEKYFIFQFISVIVFDEVSKII